MELGLDRLSRHGQVVTLLLAAAAGLLVFQVSWVRPVQEEISLAEQDLARTRVEINQALQTAGRLRALETAVEDLTGQFESLAATLPDEREAPALLRRLQTLARQSNLSLRAFAPQAVERREFDVAWPTRLELTGTYHNLGVFFDHVDKVSQLIAISDLVIEEIQHPEGDATIRAECTATTFVLNDQVTDGPSVLEPAI